MAAALRLARASDTDQLVALEHAAFSGDRLSRASFRRLIGSAGAALLVAESGAGIAGYALLLFRKGAGVSRLYSIAVHPRLAGEGLGSLLLEAAEAAAASRNRGLMRLEVREDNDVARRFYDRRGYRLIERIEGFYEDGAAALRLQKALAASPAGRARNAGSPRVEEGPGSRPE